MKNFADPAHYFDWCAIQEKTWRVRVSRNPKAKAVAAKLAEWHRKNPDHNIVNMAERRIARARRALTGA